MINFTVGPVQSPSVVLEIGGQSCPYFRTPEFSEIMLENERLVKEFAEAPDGSRAVFMTGSGTASMEAVVMNVLSDCDRAIVVDGGSFGHRFCQLCDIHNIPYGSIKLQVGHQLRREDLEAVASQGTKHTALLVNIHETSTGVHYDLNLIAEYCKRKGLLLIVDAISSFLADEFNMSECGADVMIAGSQKALACPPGVSVIVMSPRALKRVESAKTTCLYLDLKDALKNQERGQTPFTPAVGILLQINARLREIAANGGVRSEIEKVHSLALDFRTRIAGLPLKIISESMSNAVTPLSPTNGMSAYDVFTELKDRHGIWVCPNGGELKEKVFRVGHIGTLSEIDNVKLIFALEEVLAR